MDNITVIMAVNGKLKRRNKKKPGNILLTSAIIAVSIGFLFLLYYNFLGSYHFFEWQIRNNGETTQEQLAIYISSVDAESDSDIKTDIMMKLSGTYESVLIDTSREFSNKFLLAKNSVSSISLFETFDNIVNNKSIFDGKNLNVYLQGSRSENVQITFRNHYLIVKGKSENDLICTIDSIISTDKEEHPNSSYSFKILRLINNSDTTKSKIVKPFESKDTIEFILKPIPQK